MDSFATLCKTSLGKKKLIVLLSTNLTELNSVFFPLLKGKPMHGSLLSFGDVQLRKAVLFLSIFVPPNSQLKSHSSTASDNQILGLYYAQIMKYLMNFVLIFHCVNNCCTLKKESRV